VALLEASNLNKEFGKVHAVDDISLTVSAGEICGLVGADGAGKTTLLRLLSGAMSPGSGNIFLNGMDMLRQTEQARASLGYLPQRFSLYEDLTVMENIRFFAEVRGLDKTEWLPRCVEILEFVDLGQFKNRKAGHLSGGMKQKLGLAAALVHRPKLLLLDEATTGVDPVTRQDFWRLVIRLVGNEGVGVLISTPYMDEAARCSRVIFLDRGRLLLEGAPGELVKRLDRRVLELQGSPLLLLREVSSADIGVENVQRFGDKLHIRVREGEADQVLTRLSQDIRAASGVIRRFRPVRPQLDDIFILLMEQHEIPTRSDTN
jgi:ABC-2 type transport system ATP-binding protein